MKNKTHLNMSGFKLPHMGSEKQVGPYKSALHAHTPGHNEPSFAPVSTPPSFHETFMTGGAMGAGVRSDERALSQYRTSKLPTIVPEVVDVYNYSNELYNF